MLKNQISSLGNIKNEHIKEREAGQHRHHREEKTTMA
jgi:hypothetical protein